MSPGREYAAAAAATLAGAAALLAATNQTWATGAVEDPGPLEPAPVALTAAAVSPTAAALGWASLAALAAMFATKGIPRRAVGLLLAVFGGAAAADVWRGTRPGALAEAAAAQATADGRLTMAAGVSGWVWAALAGGLLLAAAGVLTLLRGGSWPGMGSRYDRPGTRSAARSDDPVDLWRALDSGADPTLAAGAESPAHPEQAPAGPAPARSARSGRPQDQPQDQSDADSKETR
ncbi:putative membrane protein (TIGR02234 family) [Murinocardiopsis flavida]|uniref:Putative membrane protein (TIGR02234 family) n=1 Tax=Murinocardiopsis flavida TaxID=645275 RepID=A0A2P8CNK2_9ACTN|nr:Trp biosynthesis-associated membrane protein [Murinocardiopsis flavida]PSK86555.1 putative membrane protein (TIGR02234 family) [Murinocardiopsis flavida]